MNGHTLRRKNAFKSSFGEAYIKRLSQDNQFVRIKCLQMLEISTLPTHLIICKLYSSPPPTIMTTRKQSQQNQGQANFLLQMFLVFNTALATDHLKPTFNIY